LWSKWELFGGIARKSELFGVISDVYLSHAGYNVLDQPTGWALGGVLTQALSYDPISTRIQSLRAVNAGGIILQDLSFSFDLLGHLDVYTDLGRGFSLDHAYDPLDRLVGVASSLYPQDYDYDPISNLTGRDGVELTYADPARPHAVSATSDGTSYGYDANGNLTTTALSGGQVVTYTYDAENRLTQVGNYYQFTLDEVNGGDWGENVAIFGESGDTQLHPNMVSDVNGALYLVWTERTDVGNEIRFAVRSPGGNWSPPEVVRAAAYMDYDPGWPVVTVDLDGNVTVAWEEYNTLSVDYNIRVRHRDAAGYWETGSEVVAGSPADEQRPALVAAPNGTVYLAWQSDAAGQNTVYVARRPPASSSWTFECQTSADPDHFFPSLASDSQGNVYLSYVVGYYSGFSSNGDVYTIRRDVLSGTWATSPELVSDSYIYSYSGDPPALAADSHDNLFVAWGGGGSLFLRQRLAATGVWAPIERTGYPQARGLDLVVDNQDVPQWITGDDADNDWLEIRVNGVNIVDYDVGHAGGPTIALGPGGMHVAVWSANRGPDTRLFMVCFGQSPQIVDASPRKSYRGAGRQKRGRKLASQPKPSHVEHGRHPVPSRPGAGTIGIW
jgi:YD repeat-containing protein